MQLIAAGAPWNFITLIATCPTGNDSPKSTAGCREGTKPKCSTNWRL